MKSTRATFEEQEAVRGRLQSIFPYGGLVLSIITGIFGINVDAIPGAEESPYAFALFTYILTKLIVEEHVEVRKLELQELVKMFQQRM
ncbi:hypothetical protein TorRG33x02_135680 [Trema orientale]|uniref:Uncharacterized protein n=1 Tax=Trema orientale TaxID=63057 RepID=A0A2P5EYU6_TREOI|nr:hypothetical protein TorRG33x02_135680 [Trema orientale]